MKIIRGMEILRNKCKKNKNQPKEKERKTFSRKEKYRNCPYYFFFSIYLKISTVAIRCKTFIKSNQIKYSN